VGHSTEAVVYPPSVWYDPLKKEGTTTMNTDALGRLIKVGDVCAFASRRGSQIYQDTVIIREVLPGGVKGDKLVKEWVHATASTLAGWQVKKVPTHLIVKPSHMIITDLTEQQAVDLMRIRSER
jgi:hypothetical protein